MSAELGMVAAARATEVDSAIEALDFETEPPTKPRLQCGSKGIGARLALFAGCLPRPSPNVHPRI
jgi:hypothetical protein